MVETGVYMNGTFLLEGLDYASDLPETDFVCSRIFNRVLVWVRSWTHGK